MLLQQITPRLQQTPILHHLTLIPQQEHNPSVVTLIIQVEEYYVKSEI